MVNVRPESLFVVSRGEGGADSGEDGGEGGGGEGSGEGSNECSGEADGSEGTEGSGSGSGWCGSGVAADELLLPIPRVACSAGEAGTHMALDFGSAEDGASFTKFASYINANARLFDQNDPPFYMARGVAACPCCQKYFATVGSQPALAAHMRSLVRSCNDHISWAKSQPADCVKLLCAEAQAAAPPGSPAHYRNVVHRKATRLQQPEEARRRREWSRSVHTASAKAECDAGRDRQEAERASRDTAAGFERLGGGVAREWGRRARAGAAVSQYAYDWAWLDAVPDRMVKELDVLVSRAPLLAHAAEFQAVLAFGLTYLAEHGCDAIGLRGLKFVVLAKAVTTGRLRTDVAPRLSAEVLGRIRLVSAGRLQTLAEELFREAEDASAELRQLRPVDVETVCAPQQPPPTNEQRLRTVLRLCSAGYLSKGYSQFGAPPLADTADPTVRDNET